MIQSDHVIAHLTLDKDDFGGLIGQNGVQVIGGGVGEYRGGLLTEKG